MHILSSIVFAFLWHRSWWTFLTCRRECLLFYSLYYKKPVEEGQSLTSRYSYLRQANKTFALLQCGLENFGVLTSWEWILIQRSFIENFKTRFESHHSNSLCTEVSNDLLFLRCSLTGDQFCMFLLVFPQSE